MQGGVLIMKQFKLKRPAAAHISSGRQAATPQQKLVLSIVRSFLFGIGTALILLAAGAAAFAALPLPGAAVRPAACLIAGLAAAVSGASLAAGIGKQRLLCGLASGAFYAACLAVASAATGELVLSEANIALLCVLVFSGMFGGVLTALRPAQHAR